MIAIVIAVLKVLMAFSTPVNVDAVIVIPSSTPEVVAVINATECVCDECCYAQAVKEYEDEFTALFESYTYKLSKNGRSMVNGKFVKMGAK